MNNDIMQVSDLSQEDIDTYNKYIKLLVDLEKRCDELLHDGREDLFDSMHDAKLAVQDWFLVFVRGLQKEVR